MHDLTGFSKIQLILLTFKGFFSPCSYLAAILLDGNELTAGLQKLVNVGDNNIMWRKQLQSSNSSAEICVSRLTKHLSCAVDTVGLPILR